MCTYFPLLTVVLSLQSDLFTISWVDHHSSVLRASCNLPQDLMASDSGMGAAMAAATAAMRLASAARSEVVREATQ
jgi:hypothetical protein